MSLEINMGSEKNTSAPTLVLDLDGTLLRSDLLWESLASWVLPRPWRVVHVLYWLSRGGRALLKHRLAEKVNLHGESLPWNKTVLEFCQGEHAAGRRLILATASSELIAKKVTRHFHFLTDVWGSSETENLKGQVKAVRLSRSFGAQGFDYVGDALADLPVWAEARNCFFVGRRSLAESLEKKLGRELKQLEEKRRVEPWLAWWKALRPHQWLKNVLVFLPFLAAHQWSDIQLWGQTVLIFLALCLLASASYLVNDLVDLHSDRLHTRKMQRPLASGDLSLPQAMVGVFCLFCLGTALAACCGWMAWVGALLYFLLSLIYSFWIKTIAVCDVLHLSGLYTYRILLGGWATGVWISPWMLGFSVTFFLGLALLKRFVEIDHFSSETKEELPGRGYKKSDKVLVLSAGLSFGLLSVVVLIFYLDSSASQMLYQAPQWLWGMALALLGWTLRIWFLAGRKRMDDDPVWFAARDGVTLILVTVCLLCILLAGPR
jgi:4-hydroxybenzoate polyprenyltransferase/phosphoserine phosphatase